MTLHCKDDEERERGNRVLISLHENTIVLLDTAMNLKVHATWRVDRRTESHWGGVVVMSF
jgi:hypothetical protein